MLKFCVPALLALIIAPQVFSDETTEVLDMYWDVMNRAYLKANPDREPLDVTDRQVADWIITNFRVLAKENSELKDRVKYDSDLIHRLREDNSKLRLQLKAVVNQPAADASLNKGSTKDQDATPDGFRGAWWGMSYDSVRIKFHEEANFDASGSSVSFDTSVAGEDALAALFFTNGELTHAGYSFDNEYTSENRYLDDFYDVAELLTERYGEPDDSAEVWNDEEYKNDAKKRGFAVAVGDLRIFDTYIAGNTKIVHSLYGENFRVSHVIRYVSISHEKAIDADRKRRNSEGL